MSIRILLLFEALRLIPQHRGHPPQLARKLLQSTKRRRRVHMHRPPVDIPRPVNASNGREAEV
ncbi:hypothetical protein ACEE62_04685 [Corynebacterium sp. 32222D000BW]